MTDAELVTKLREAAAALQERIPVSLRNGDSLYLKAAARIEQLTVPKHKPKEVKDGKET